MELEPLILENQSILLRPMMKQDFSLLMKLTGDPLLWEYFTYDLSQLEEFGKWAEPGFTGERVQFTVVDKSSQELIGSTAFGNFSARDRRIEIGWTWIGKNFQGKGYNQQMKFLMLEYAFEKMELMRVEIKTDVLNIPARKALMRMGIKEEGVLRSHTLLCTGRRRDTIYYSVLADEWPSLKRNWKKNDLK